MQTIYCQATGGYLNLSLPVTVSQRTGGGGGGEGQQHIRHGAGPKGGGGGGTLLEVMVPFDASAGTLEAEIERLFGVVDVTVTYSEGHEQLCVPTVFPDLVRRQNFTFDHTASNEPPRRRSNLKLPSRSCRRAHT